MLKYGYAALIFVCILILDRHFNAYMPTHLFGMYVASFLLLSYYGLIYIALRATRLKVLYEIKKNLIGILFISMLSLLFVIGIASQDHTIYVYDNLETWEPAVHVSSQVFENPYQAVRDLGYSINHATYNNLIPMLIAIPMHFIGISFVHYISCVWLMFGVPAIILIGLFTKSWLSDLVGCNVPLFVLLLVDFCIPSLLFPVLNGYANVSILLPTSILLVLLLGLGTHHSRAYSLLISIMAVLCVLQARTAAYAVVGLFGGYALFSLYQGYKENNVGQACIFLIKQYIGVGIISATILLIFFRPFFINALTYDIATAYSAYALGADFLERLESASQQTGIIINSIALVAMACGACMQQIRSHVILFLTWIVLGTVLFCKVQLMGVQHIYIVLLPLMVLVSGLCGWLFCRYRFFSFVLLFFVSLNFAQAYFHVFPMEWCWRHEPQIRYDVSAIKEMTLDMQAESEINNDKVYFISSSRYYNHTTLSKSAFPEQKNAIPNMMVTADVDLRDGFPVHFFDADIILVATPVQVHLGYEDQSVVSLLAEDMLSENQLSRHYKFEKEYVLSPHKPIEDCEADDPSLVYIKMYRKVSPLEKADIDFVQGQFEAVYPEQPDLFRDRFEKYKQVHF